MNLKSPKPSRYSWLGLGIVSDFSSNPFDHYESSVEVGLGFPLGRTVQHDAPVGWLVDPPAEVVNVSRETSSAAVEARKQQG